MSKKVFVTGGKGFIGSHLVDKLVRLGYEVASFDAKLNFIEDTKYYKKCLRLRDKILKQAARLFAGDIRNLGQLERAIKNFSPDVVVHLAGLPMARVAEQFHDDMVTINLHGTLNVIKSFEKSSAKKLIYTSSSMVYGHFKQTPQTEDFILTPENLYGSTKAAGEYFIKLLKKDWVIIRPTSVYGFTDCANRVTQLLLDAAMLKKPAWVIKGETLDFSYIDDVVDGYIKCIRLPQAVGHTFNISRGEGRAASEFAEIIKSHFPGFQFEIREPIGSQVWRGPMDITKARKILGFNPKFNIEQGIARLIKLIKKHNFYSLK